jgi:hypothetical protein
MKLNRRQRAIGRRIAELIAGPPTEQARAEVRDLVAELEATRPAPPAPAPELQPGSGTFAMRKAPSRAAPAPEDTEDDRWAKVMAMRSGTGAAAMIYAPERAR